MDTLTQLIEDAHRGASPLLQPRPLAHSQELAEGLPLVRRHLGPRAWYQSLEAGLVPEKSPS